MRVCSACSCAWRRWRPCSTASTSSSSGVIALLWSALTLIPLLVVFGVRQQVAGWSFAEALVVMAWFMLLRARPRGRGQPQPDGGGRARAQGHARLRAAQAGRRAVPGVDREVRALAHRRRRGRAGSCSCYAFHKLGHCADARAGRDRAGVPRAGGADALLDLDPGRQRRVLGGEGRQPLVPVRLDLRRRRAGRSTCSAACGAGRC